MEIKTRCPICQTYGNSALVYSSNVDIQNISVEVFSARRLPDRQHYQWVRCDSCGLLRSDPVLDINLAQLYEGSTFDYSTEVNGLKRTYFELVRKATGTMVSTHSIFEVGCGNGFFLEAVKDFGFKKIAVTEPSNAAIEAARGDVKP